MSGVINFFVEDIDFSLAQEDKLSFWVKKVIESHDSSIEELTYIFVSDSYLLEMNQKHLNHNTLTDIITFPYVEGRGASVAADIFISVERVMENAEKMDISFIEELHRVMIHGVLHLIGLDDKDETGKVEMRKAEDFALSLRKL